MVPAHHTHTHTHTPRLPPPAHLQHGRGHGGELAAQGIVFAVARSRGLFDGMLERSGLAERIGAAHMFPSVRSGVEAYLAQAEALAGLEAR